MTTATPTDALSALISSSILAIDVGADGGVKELRGLAHLCDIHAFEPRKDSFDELTLGQDPAIKNLHDRYRRLTVHNCGLAAEAGTHTLHITRVPQASSLLVPDAERVARWRGDGAFDVVDKADIDCVTFGQFIETIGAKHVDFIKLDTQGTELNILLGAERFLPNISVIYSEVEFTALYRDQFLFDDFVAKLRPHGFQFVGFHELTTSNGEDQGKKIWAEATFVNTRLPHCSDEAMKAGLILMELGYIPDGKWLLADAGFDDTAIERAAGAFAETAGTGFVQGLAWTLIEKARRYNARRVANGAKPLNFGRIKSALALFPFGKQLLALLTRVSPH